MWDHNLKSDHVLHFEIGAAGEAFILVMVAFDYSSTHYSPMVLNASNQTTPDGRPWDWAKPVLFICYNFHCPLMLQHKLTTPNEIYVNWSYNTESAHTKKVVVTSHHAPFDLDLYHPVPWVDQVVFLIDSAVVHHVHKVYIHMPQGFLEDWEIKHFALFSGQQSRCDLKAR